MSRPAPAPEEIVAVVTGGGAKKIFHRLEDGEPVCGPSRRSNTRRVERAVLGNTYRPCRTCFQTRSLKGGAGRGPCPLCGENSVILVDHLPECDGADDYFKEEMAR